MTKYTDLMTKYTSNDQYENDKKKMIFAFGNDFFVRWEDDYIPVTNLLKQSKWIGSDFSIKPIPVIKDKHGKLTKDYSTKDWFAKIQEEVTEAHAVAAVIDDCKECGERIEDITYKKLAEELQDLITVCTSMLQWLGFDESKRNELAMQVNDKNRNRGYFE